MQTNVSTKELRQLNKMPEEQHHEAKKNLNYIMQDKEKETS